ncbi:MAG: PH domain-containing protein [Cyanobacteria bacterium P01_H01_bin.121]
MGLREEIYYEGGPHIGDLIFNVLIGFTVIGLPFTVGAIVRALWLRYRITDRRVSVTGGWMGRDRSDVIYTELSAVNAVPRGLGFWGDMVIVLKDGSRLEMRAVPNFRATVAYLEERIATRNKQPLNV